MATLRKFLELEFNQPFARLIKRRSWPISGAIYGLCSTHWLLGMLPTEWIGLPTWPTGIAIALCSWLAAGSLCSVLFVVFGSLRYHIRTDALRILAAPILMSLLWNISPLSIIQPGYLFAYLPIEQLARWGGVFTLTAIAHFLVELCMQLICTPMSKFFWIPCLLIALPIPPATISHFPGSPLRFYIVQLTGPRQLESNVQRIEQLVDRTPLGSIVLLGEGVFRPGNRPADWLQRIAHKTVVWGEIRQVNGQLHNTLYAHTPDGKLYTYDKSHLAPLIEWTGPPLIDALVWKLTGWPPFRAGDKPGLWNSPFGIVSVGICYDSAWSLDGPAQLGIILTNDDWLGSGFTAQRDRVERIRAIELGSPIIRVSNRSSAVSYPDKSLLRLTGGAGLYPIYFNNISE